RCLHARRQSRQRDPRGTAQRFCATEASVPSAAPRLFQWQDIRQTGTAVRSSRIRYAGPAILVACLCRNELPKQAGAMARYHRAVLSTVPYISTDSMLIKRKSIEADANRKSGPGKKTVPMKPPRTVKFAPVTLSEQFGVRYLHFGTEWVQGAMRVSKPDWIEL